MHKYVFLRRERNTEAPGVSFAVFAQSSDTEIAKWLRQEFGQYLPKFGEEVTKLWIRPEGEKVWTVETETKLWRMLVGNRLQFLDILYSVMEKMEVTHENR